ncbi:hypothetical protein [Acidipila sp. EB88]|uniref:hypothetical protein n=1 Tax=Acidipila sp. EB88 TaxID=2305226 RepID=UPI000F5F7FA5|nr:hypothetical protein [Acidipila sp. EB88]RRA49712.1 hypothetical protein D1Y84_17000 [Acidipila sp. EB88]
MSKEAEARVRDELLQELYASALRCSLASSQADVPGGVSAGVAAGLFANLRPTDLLVLPQRGAGTLRTLRDLSYRSQAHTLARDQAACVLPLPTSETAAVAYVLGAATAAPLQRDGALVCVVLPPRSLRASPSQPRGSKSKQQQFPTTWAHAAHYAAVHALPLLFITDAATTQRTQAANPAQPAPLYPTIPVDREDALAIYRVAFECSTRARSASGPSHLQCVAVAGLPAAAMPHGAKAQPEQTLARLEQMLRKRGAFAKAWHRALERRLIREITEA